MILILFNCLCSWSEESKDSHFFTGKGIQTDTSKTSVVVLPIDIIREANVKLNERIILKELVSNQSLQIHHYKELDSMARLRNEYLLNEIDTLIDDKEKLNKSKNIYKAISIAEAIALISIILGCICN